MIGVEWGRDARDRLEGVGVPVTYRESRMGHTIDPAYLETLRAWLASTVPPQAL